jgi:hypothetical protein
MTIHDDQNMNRQINEKRRADAERWSAGSIILGSLAALAAIFGIFYILSDRNPNVANRADRPLATSAPSTTPTTTPAQSRAGETTGSGTTDLPPATNR